MEKEVVKRIAERFDGICEMKQELYLAAKTSNAAKFETLLERLASKAEQRGNLGHNLMGANHHSTLKKVSERYQGNSELMYKIYGAGRSKDSRLFDDLLCQMLERAEAMGELGHNLLRKLPK